MRNLLTQNFTFTLNVNSIYTVRSTKLGYEYTEVTGSLRLRRSYMYTKMH